MNDDKNYCLEEYKILKEEVSTFTNQTFRDFQLFIAIITIFFAVVSSKENNFPKVASYAFMQLAVFIFMSIQFNRVVYLIVVRKHLAGLENVLNKDVTTGFIFQWESKIVPSKISPWLSYSSISQAIIGLMYLTIFYILCDRCLYHWKLSPHDMPFNIRLYYILLAIEVLFIVGSLFHILKSTVKK